MRIALVFCWLLLALPGASDVPIPDGRFREALTALGHDANGDGRMSDQEALAVTNLQLPNMQIASLDGVRAFQNLKVLNVGQNPLLALDLRDLTKLDALLAYQTNVRRLNTEGCSSLRLINLWSSPLSGVQLSHLPALETLNLDDCQLGSLDLRGLTRLKNVRANNNVIRDLQLGDNFALTELHLENNALKRVVLIGAPSLRNVNVARNLISHLDIRGLGELEEVLARDNPIALLKMGGNQKLKVAP